MWEAKCLHVFRTETAQCQLKLVELEMFEAEANTGNSLDCFNLEVGEEVNFQFH